jgi:hypothetical protein
MIKPGFPGDPIKAYGQRAAEMLLSDVRRVPPAFRPLALKAVFKEVEPGLEQRIEQRTRKYRAAGMPQKQALKSAIASSMSEGFVRELAKIGRGQQPSMRSQLGLSYYGDEAQQLALEGLWSTIKDGAKAVGGAVKSAAKAVGSGVSSGASAAWSFGSGAISKLGSLACGVLKNPAASLAAGAAAGPAGAAGAQAGSQLCSSSSTPAASQTALMAPQHTTPAWVLPAAIGGVGLLAAILLLRK